MDVLRIIAAIAVVVFHVLSSSASNDPSISDHLYSTAMASATMLQWHVPVFFMITGYLWLNENKECTYQKAFSHIRRFVLVLFTVGFAYALMERFFVSRTISIDLFTHAFADVLNGNLWDHMWYLYSIIGIYLLLPVLSPFFECNRIKAISILSIILFAFTIISPVVEEMAGYTFPISFPITAPAFYICAGGLIAKIKSMPRITTITAAVVFFCSCISAFFCTKHNMLDNSGIAVLTCFSAVSLFLLITGIFSNIPEIPWVRAISDCSFGIYLFHPFFINILIKVLHIFPLQWLPPISITLVSLAVAGLSYLVTYLLRKIRFIRRFIL